MIRETVEEEFESYKFITAQNRTIETNNLITGGFAGSPVLGIKSIDREGGGLGQMYVWFESSKPEDMEALEGLIMVLQNFKERNA